jgi:phage terminase small subunit
LNKHYRFRGGQMPRSSAEERAAKAYRAGGKRPAPPAFLNEEAAATWRKIVAAKPLGWFDEGNLPLLALYCAGRCHGRF